MHLRSVPLLLPINYAKWKLKMVAYLERHDILDVPFGVGKESYEEENDWLNDCDRSYGSMGMVMSPNMHYLMEFVEYPIEFWRNIDRAFSVQREVDNT